jgi:hypothetical protein
MKEKYSFDLDQVIQLLLLNLRPIFQQPSLPSTERDSNFE